MVRLEVSEEWAKVSESSEVPEVREAVREVELEVAWAAVQAAVSTALMHSWVVWW
jgi:hypothetical protein